MSCCDETTRPRTPIPTCLGARCFRGAALVASVLPCGATLGGPKRRASRSRLAYCSQLLCGVPYEVAPRTAGTFKNHGLDVQIVYTPRRQRRHAGPWSAGRWIYAATALDVAIPGLCQCRREHPPLSRSPGVLPLFCRRQPLPRPPTGFDRSRIWRAGRSAFFPALGNADHALTLYSAEGRPAPTPQKVQFATMGVNLLEALRQGQIDVGLVQEPALTLLRRSGGARAHERNGPRRRQALSRRFLRIHGRRGAHPRDRAAQAGNGCADQGIGRGAQRRCAR